MKHHIIWLLICATCTIATFVARQPQVIEVTKTVKQEVPVEVIKQVPREVIKEVPKEVIKEVVKVVEIPAQIPVEYSTAKSYYDQIIQAKFFESNGELKSLKKFKVLMQIAGGSISETTKNDIKNKIELELQRSGIRISDSDAECDAYVTFKFDGIWNENKTIFSYSNHIILEELVYVFRRNSNAKFSKAIAATWTKGYNGYAGGGVLNEAASENAVNLATAFANAYLKANAE